MRIAEGRATAKEQIEAERDRRNRLQRANDKQVGSLEPGTRFEFITAQGAMGRPRKLQGEVIGKGLEGGIRVQMYYRIDGRVVPTLEEWLPCTYVTPDSTKAGIWVRSA